MTFIVETFIKPNDLINPKYLNEILHINYNQLLSELINTFRADVDSDLTHYGQLKRNVNTLIFKLFDAYTQLGTDSVRLTDNLTNIKAQLDTLKVNNVSLKEELARMYDISDGSSELINDYKELYNINYTRNWGVFLSIIFSCYVMSAMFKSKPITL